MCSWILAHCGGVPHKRFPAFSLEKQTISVFFSWRLPLENCCTTQRSLILHYHNINTNHKSDKVRPYHLFFKFVNDDHNLLLCHSHLGYIGPKCMRCPWAFLRIILGFWLCRHMCRKKIIGLFKNKQTVGFRVTMLLGFFCSLYVVHTEIQLPRITIKSSHIKNGPRTAEGL